MTKMSSRGPSVTPLYFGQGQSSITYAVYGPIYLLTTTFPFQGRYVPEP